MREILFRGKRVDNGEWVEGAYYKQTEFYGDEVEDHLIITTKDELVDNMMDFYRVDPETVGQYTGTTDQNGRKVFEGDILLIRFEMDRVDGFTSYTWYESARVVFSDEKHAWIVVFDEGGEELYLNEYDDLDDVRVVGTIHDNPEKVK